MLGTVSRGFWEEGGIWVEKEGQHRGRERMGGIGAR